MCPRPQLQPSEVFSGSTVQRFAVRWPPPSPSAALGCCRYAAVLAIDAVGSCPALPALIGALRERSEKGDAALAAVTFAAPQLPADRAAMYAARCIPNDCICRPRRGFLACPTTVRVPCELFAFSRGRALDRAHNAADAAACPPAAGEWPQNRLWTFI